MEFVEPLDKQQVGQLLDDGERVGNPAGPHRVPDFVNFGSEVAGDHVRAEREADFMVRV